MWRLNNPICVRQDTIFYTVYGDLSNNVLWSGLKDSSFLFYLTEQVSVQQNIVFPEVEKMGSLGSGSYNFAANRSHLMGWGILPLYQMRKRKTGPGPDLSTELLIRSNHGAMRGSFWYHKKTWLELAVSSVFNYILFLGAPSPPEGLVLGENSTLKYFQQMYLMPPMLLLAIVCRYF